MTARRVSLCALVALTAGLAGCGQSSGSRSPQLGSLPIVPGAKIVAQVKQCDRGANAFCAWIVVVTDQRYGNSTDLLHGERDVLVKSGWTLANGDTGEQHAADSPGHKLRVTYATAYGDAKGVALGWIKRPRPIALALSHTLFTRTSAISMMLELGAS